MDKQPTMKRFVMGGARRAPRAATTFDSRQRAAERQIAHSSHSRT